MNKITVIVTNYNYQRYLMCCIKSLFNQTYPIKQLILIDDGSVNFPFWQIEEFIQAINTENIEIHIIKNFTNNGKNYCINFIRDLITSEFVSIVDADDILHNDFFKKTMETFEVECLKDKKLGFVYTDNFLIDEHGQYLGHGKSTKFNKHLIDRYSFIPDNALTLRECFLSQYPLSNEIRFGTKHHRWKKIIANNWNGYHLSKQLFYYRMHDNNLSCIGQRIKSDLLNGNNKEAMLIGYWPISGE